MTKNTLSPFSSSREQPLINLPQCLSSWTPSFFHQSLYKKLFSSNPTLIATIEDLIFKQEWKLYHNISTSSFPSRVWIINTFVGIFIFCMSNLVTLSMSKNFMDIVGKHKIIISHRLQGCFDMIFIYHDIKTENTVHNAVHRTHSKTIHSTLQGKVLPYNNIRLYVGCLAFWVSLWANCILL